MPAEKPQIPIEIESVKLVPAFAAVVLSCGLAHAAQTPLPRPRPADPGHAAAPLNDEAASKRALIERILADPGFAKIPDPDPPGMPSACQTRLTGRMIAVFHSLPAIRGPGDCGAPDLVQVDTIVMPDNSRVTMSPPATMQCEMAEQIIQWVRDDVGPLLARSGGAIRELDNYASYHCRGRNNVAGARTSEHGYGNAIDIRGVKLADGTFVTFTERSVARLLREELREDACARFRTVLGPGSDGYHEEHIHLDMRDRRGDFKLCQWNVDDPVANIPLPRPRPPEANGEKKSG